MRRASNPQPLPVALLVRVTEAVEGRGNLQTNGVFNMNGTIRTVNLDKGYGFAEVPGQSRDVFVHATRDQIRRLELTQGRIQDLL
jgi:hypothetical protein